MASFPFNDFSQLKALKKDLEKKETVGADYIAGSFNDLLEILN